MSDLVGRWNHYFLRYCAGTIVGAIIVMFLVEQHIGCANNLFLRYFLQQKDNNTIELGVSAIAALAALGFAYCYIASAPGAVFHAARGIFDQRNRDARNLSTFLFRTTYALAVLSQLVVIFMVLRYTPTIIYCLSLGQAWMVFEGVSIGIFVLLFQSMLLLSVFFNFGLIQQFYRNMTRARSRSANNIEHFRKSYRDLREHGNAFEIIILEFVLTSILICSKDLFPLIIVIWILPAAFCWIIGTMLEFRIPRPIIDAPTANKISDRNRGN